MIELLLLAAGVYLLIGLYVLLIAIADGLMLPDCGDKSHPVDFRYLSIGYKLAYGLVLIVAWPKLLGVL